LKRANERPPHAKADVPASSSATNSTTAAASYSSKQRLTVRIDDATALFNINHSRAQSLQLLSLMRLALCRSATRHLQRRQFRL